MLCCYVKADQLGIEPMTCKSEVQCPTTAPPCNRYIIGMRRQSVVASLFSCCCDGRSVTINIVHLTTLVAQTSKMLNNWWKNFNKGCIAGRQIFYGVMTLSCDTSQSAALLSAVAVGLWCHYWFYLQHTMQQSLAMLFCGQDHCQITPSPGRIWTPSVVCAFGRVGRSQLFGRFSSFLVFSRLLIVFFFILTVC